mmetsp:Transcript_47085/g.105645  ORF Transcript_47085/g.105645 Transcript_47085/m.105645 type:complete len:248 (-) Transcript_47085:30-773(-)
MSSQSSSDFRCTCIALWHEAQRSPSIIGFNVHPALSDTINVSIDGTSQRAAAADVRLWQAHESDTASSRIFLEFLFPGVPKAWDEWQVGEACVAVVQEHVSAQRVEEFRAKLVARKKAQELRRRGADRQGEAGLEHGDASEDNWRQFLQQKADADAGIRLHAVADVGSTARRVLAVRVSVTPSEAYELGELAYPSIFRPLYADSSTLQEEDRKWQQCYNGTVAFLAILALLWLTFFIRGLGVGWNKA